MAGLLAHVDSDNARFPLEEIRFGVILNGGASLAVWMGGTVVELDRLTKAGHRATAVTEQRRSQHIHQSFVHGLLLAALLWLLFSWRVLLLHVLDQSHVESLLVTRTSGYTPPGWLIGGLLGLGCAWLSNSGVCGGV